MTLRCQIFTKLVNLDQEPSSLDGRRRCRRLSVQSALMASPIRFPRFAESQMPPCLYLLCQRMELALTRRLSHYCPLAVIRLVLCLCFFVVMITTTFIFALVSLLNLPGKREPFLSAEPIPQIHYQMELSEQHFAVAIDCGSSGSRVFVYSWPRQQRDFDLLRIAQLKDFQGKSVVMKIEPGISSLAPDRAHNATNYVGPLLSFAASHIPREKHKETPLFILATAGMRMLPISSQNLILSNLRANVKNEFDFVYGDNNFQVISGKEEGVFQWIAANFMLGKFKHITEGDDPLVVVQSTLNRDVVRKRTVGVLDMGGGSLQIAFEITKNRQWRQLQSVRGSKDLIAEFNLGCHESDTKHNYRIYVSTFLGFGGNEVFRRYFRYTAEAFKALPTVASNVSSDAGSSSSPVEDPCLAKDQGHTVETFSDSAVHFIGIGNFSACEERLSYLFFYQLLCPHGETDSCSINGTFQPKINSYNSEFYGFSEFYYSSFDILGLKGHYDAEEFARAAQRYCETPWAQSLERHARGVYPLADAHRLRTQCFKSAYVRAALHRGFKFPVVYSSLTNVQLVEGQEVQWTLGALLYRMRFYPLADQRSRRRLWDTSSGLSESSKTSRPHHQTFFDRSLPFSHHLLLALIAFVILAIAFLARRLRRWILRPSNLQIGARPLDIECPAGRRLRKSSESSHFDV